VCVGTKFYQYQPVTVKTQVNKQSSEVKDVNTETEWKIDTDNAVLEGSNPNSAHTQ